VSDPRMNDMHQQHPDDHLSDDALRALAARLDASGAAFARERAGLADRVFAASVADLRGAQPPLVLHAVRRWAMSAAAVVVVGATAAFLMMNGRGPSVAAPELVSVRAAEIAPVGGSEALLVALIDADAALKSTEGGSSFDASAIVLTSGHSVDDVTVELDELLAAGGKR